MKNIKILVEAENEKEVEILTACVQEFNKKNDIDPNRKAEINHLDYFTFEMDKEISAFLLFTGISTIKLLKI